jgi:hypothetical protein
MQEHRSIPEIRGCTPIPRERINLYNAPSYAALYGITLDLAEDIVSMDHVQTHSDAERIILRYYRDNQLEFRQMLKEAIVEVTPEQVKEAEEYAKYHGAKTF